MKSNYDCPATECSRSFYSKRSVISHLQHCDYNSGDLKYPTKKMLISDLKRVAELIDKSPNSDEYDQHGSFGTSTLETRFKSFNESKRLAGLSIGRERNISKQDLINDLQKISEKINKSPTSKEYEKHSDHTTATLQRNFGSFNRAKEKAGLTTESPDATGKDSSVYVENKDRWIETNEARKWKNDVFERDNYICQDCGDDTGGNLNAHHIKRRNDHPELRDCVENGITLCKTCHTERHSNENFYEMLKSNSDKDYSKMLSERRERLEKLEEPYFVKNRENVPFIREPKNEPNV